MIIDPNDFPAIRELLQKWNMKPELVLLTHEHCDHIGGLNQLQETYPVTVVATQACSEGIGNKTRNMSRMMETFLYFKSGEKTFVHYPPFQCEKADLIFTDKLSCEFGAKELELIRLPGHTPGSHGDPGMTDVYFAEIIFFRGTKLSRGCRGETEMPMKNMQDHGWERSRTEHGSFRDMENLFR